MIQPITAVHVSVYVLAGAAGGEEAAGGRGEDEEATVSRATCGSAGGNSTAEVKAPEKHQHLCLQQPLVDAAGGAAVGCR